MIRSVARRRDFGRDPAKISSINHVVLLVDNLADAIVEASDARFNVLPGGRHEVGGTRNARIGFDDGVFLESLGFTTASPPTVHYFATG
jgi:hypothetical protein